MILPIFWLVALVSVASCTASKIPIPTPSAGAFPFSKKSGQSSFIVQLKNDASLGKRSHDAFHKRAVNLNLDYQVQREFTNANLFYGLAIKLNQNSTFSEVNNTLSSIPEVVAVYPNRRISKPAPIQSKAKVTAAKLNNSPTAANQTSANYTSTNHTWANQTWANQTWANQTWANQTWIPVDNSTNLPHITGNMDTAVTLKMADVDKLHALGIKGKGMKIAFVDTGVDYYHPSLGGGFGPGFKVAGGYAFVDDNWDGSDAPLPGPDPLTTCFESGHGTHVSGIAGMLDPPNIGFGLTGVAPEASLYMYKVFSCVSETTSDDLIMAAMIQAAADDVDVISLSLGYEDPFQSDTPYTTLVNSITGQGIAIIAANGNDGALGIYGQSTPGSVESALAVGSVTNLKFPTVYSMEDSQGSIFQYQSVWPLVLSQALNVYSHGLECTPAAWENTGAAVTDPKNTIVIAGVTADCPLGTQMSAASAFGIQYLIGYNVAQDPVSQDAELQVPFEVTTLVVDPRTGASIIRHMKPGSPYSLKFSNATVTSTRLLTGNMISNYSTFGPTWDTVALKPQLSAPGGKILSTWPLGAYGGYAVISGTSMATPFVAACYALVRSQYPGLPVAEVISLLQSSSTPLPYVYDHSFPSSVAGQGAGIINPYKAITYKTTITPSQLEIGDTDKFLDVPQTITINNASPKAKTYTIKHQGAGYAEYFPYPDLLPPPDANLYGQPQYRIYGSASFDVSTITVPAGQSHEISVTFTPPILTPTQIHKTPVFSGFIEISSSDETFNIPYLGLPYSRKSTNAIDLTNYTISDGTSDYQCAQPCVFHYPGINDNNPNWTIRINTQFEAYNLSAWEFPNIEVNFLTGGGDYQVHVLPGNTSFVPTHYGFDPKVKTGYMNPNHTAHDTFQGVPSYGWLPDSSQYNNDVPSETTIDFAPLQSTVTFFWGAVYFETGDDWGEYLPNGDYRILISMLKPGASSADLTEWESWLSPTIRLIGNWEDF